MKYINLKTLTLMLSAFAVMVFTGCEGKVGDPSDSQLVGSVTPPGSGNTAPVANAGDAQLVIMESSGDIWYGGAAQQSTNDIQQNKEKTAFPEEAPVALKKEKSSLEATMDPRPSEYQDEKDQNITVTLDGSASFDADGDDLTYIWTLVSKPGRSEMLFEESNTATVEFDADIMGYYTFDLVVNDGEVDSEPSRVTISVKAYRIELVQRKYNDAYPTSTEMGISSTSNDNNRSFTYNEYGQTLTLRRDYENGDWNLESYTYDANGNQLTRDYNRSNGSSSKYIYTYDDNNNLLTSEGYYNGSTTWNYKSVLTYDNNSNQLTQEYYENGSITWKQRYIYTYDNNSNQLTQEYYYDGNSVWSNRYINTYDNNHNLLTKEQYSNGSTTWEYSQVYTYDSNSNMLTYELHQNGSTTWMRRSVLTYDSNNNKLHSESYENGETIWRQKYVFTYDSNNNTLSEEQYSNGSSTWWTKYVYTYDSNSNKITTEYYSDGSSTWWGKYVYTYDNQNNMLSETAYSDNSSTYDWTTVYTYTYDEHGNITYFTRDNGDDDIIEYEEDRSWILLP